MLCWVALAFSQEFRGRQKYITTCAVCQNSSEREEELDELQLSIKGRKTVASCLEGYQSVEHLTGESKYQCDTCGTKQDATRQIVITKMPEVFVPHVSPVFLPWLQPLMVCSRSLIDFLICARTGAVGAAAAVRVQPRHVGQGEA